MHINANTKHKPHRRRLLLFLKMVLHAPKLLIVVRVHIRQVLHKNVA